MVFLWIFNKQFSEEFDGATLKNISHFEKNLLLYNVGLLSLAGGSAGHRCGHDTRAMSDGDPQPTGQSRHGVLGWAAAHSDHAVTEGVPGAPADLNNPRAGSAEL